jgi:hypothetical protein
VHGKYEDIHQDILIIHFSVKCKLLDARAIGSVMHFQVHEMMVKTDQVLNMISSNNSPPPSSPSPVEEEHIMDEEEEEDEDEVVIPLIDEATANPLFCWPDPHSRSIGHPICWGYPGSGVHDAGLLGA